MAIAKVSLERTTEIKEQLEPAMRLVLNRFEQNDSNGLPVYEMKRLVENIHLWIVDAPTVPTGTTDAEMVFLIAETFWTWVARGICIPRSLAHETREQRFFFTAFGREWLAADDKECFPADPERYVDSIDRRVGGIDAVAKSYLVESVTCFNTGTYKAAMVMLGASSERLVTVLAKACLPGPKTGGNISDVFKRIGGAITGNPHR